jgi:hypothetical protein
MTPSFVYAPPSAEADATRTNEFGAKSKSSLARTAQILCSPFQWTFALSPNFSSGRCLSGADRFFLCRIHVINHSPIPRLLDVSYCLSG